MLIRFGFDITIVCAQPTPVVTMMGVHGEHAGNLRTIESFIATPPVDSTTYRDLYGNACRRFTAPAGDLQIWGDATIEDDGSHDPRETSAAETPIANLPDDCLIYLLGSRYCETDRLSQVAWDLFQHVPPGWTRAQAICDFVNRHITFDYQRARSTRTAYEAYEEGIGVCRDYAHLAISLCRCMNMPARYVNGYLGDIGVPILDPMDFSAWIEVYLGDRWHTFDPRNNIPRIGRIVAARGRDATDVPLIVSFGPHILRSFRVWAYELGTSFAPLSFTNPANENAV